MTLVAQFGESTLRWGWENLSLRRKGLVVVALPLLAGLLATSGFVWAQWQQRRAADAMATTLEVNAALERTLNLVVDNETGVRGFLLTADEAFLEPYTSSRAALPAALDDLARALAASGQSADLESLRRLVAERLNISEQLRDRPPPAQLSAVLNEGKATTDQIRGAVHRLEDRQAALLAQRRARADRAEQAARAVALASGLLAVGGGLAAMATFTRGVVHRIARLQQAAHQLEQGQLVESLTGGDELGNLSGALARASRLLLERDRDLNSRNRLLETIFSASPDAIHIVGPDGRITVASPATTRITGADPTTELGESATARVHPDDLPAAADTLHQLLSGTATHRALRYRARHTDGRWLVLESQAAALTDPAGNTTGIVAVTRDVTDQARSEQAERQARAAADAANHAKSEFLSRMSHELRTPLNAVLGFAQLLELEDLTDQQRDDVARIIKGGRHLLELINEVLDISRIETGRLSLSPEPVSLAELIHDTADLINTFAAERNVTLTLPDRKSCDHYVLADRQRLKQVLLNLLSNAVKYNRSAGHVQVHCAPTDTGTVRIDVNDTGPGIRPEHLSLLFTPFERLGAENTDIEGIGIGLALSQRLTTAMNGQLTVTSTPGEGSTFTIEIPQTPHPHPAPEQPPDRPATPTRPAPSPQHTILHIEDNLANLTLIERVIARRAHIRLIAAMQGNIGIQLATEHHPDLILLDLHLPDTTGMEVLQRLRSHPHTAQTPIIIISADATPRQIQHLLAAGATAYLIKPIDIEQLLNTIDQHIPSP